MDKEVIDLIKKGYSLNKIKNKTGINKSSIYYHYRKINGKKFKKILINHEDQEAIGEFIGIFAGDGNFFYGKNGHYRIRISTGLVEEGYASFLKTFLTELFSKEPMIYRDNKYHVYITCYYSKDIYLLIKRYLTWDGNKTKTVRLKRIDKNNRKFLMGFLRGLFDTDGCLYMPKKRVMFGTASKELAYQIKEILTLFDIEPGFYEYKMWISGILHYMGREQINL